MDSSSTMRGSVVNYQQATCHTAGPITSALFLWSTGDAHLIHHLFPNLPCYRLRRARAALLPILLRHGVVQRTSLPWRAPSRKFVRPMKPATNRLLGRA